MRTLTYRNR